MGRAIILLLTSAVALGLLSSPADADDMTGLITKVDRLNGTITMQSLPSGTVGAPGGASGALEEFKAKDAAMLDSVHAGDRVSYSVSASNGRKTLTKLQVAR